MSFKLNLSIENKKNGGIKYRRLKNVGKNSNEKIRIGRKKKRRKKIPFLKFFRCWCTRGIVRRGWWSRRIAGLCCVEVDHIARFQIDFVQRWRCPGVARCHIVRVGDVDRLVHGFRPGLHLDGSQHLETAVLGFHVGLDLRCSRVRVFGWSRRPELRSSSTGVWGVLAGGL